ncbi:amastin, putative [Bodo saltans]|uniref:Amastin, putative n=1 Tax=Bodo saltans TaxID=75058 RepID=A0A0S4J7H2_BODSA|nr:amastin, putative [Bodo saltans]|eukprot:CUG85860.1 amastin, putative [Bodo saltans]
MPQHTRLDRNVKNANTVPRGFADVPRKRVSTPTSTVTADTKIVSLAAFVFAVISTPISIFSKWTSGTTQQVVTIWHAYTYVNGVMTSKRALDEGSVCGHLDRYALTSQAFTIITIFTCLLAAGAGAATLRGTGGLKAIIVTGFFATLTGVIAAGADLVLFYKNFCNSPTFDAQHYNRDAGLALIVTVFVIMAAATLLAIGAAVLQVCSSKPESGNVSKGSFLYIFGTIVSIVFLVVALATPVLSREQNASSFVKVLWWEIQTKSGNTYTATDFQCEKLWQRLVGGGSIIIAAISISTFGAIFGVAQLSNGSLQVPATALGFLSAVLQLIAFTLAIDAWRTTYCNFNPKKAEFDYDIGFALVPAAFCVTVLVSILNLVLKA